MSVVDANESGTVEGGGADEGVEAEAEGDADVRGSTQRMGSDDTSAQREE